MSEDRPVEHWHLKKEITWGHIMTTVGMLGVFVSQYISMTNAIADVRNGMNNNRTEISHVREISTIQNQRLDRAIEEVKRQYTSISDKLDALMQKQRGMQ